MAAWVKNFLIIFVMIGVIPVAASGQFQQRSLHIGVMSDLFIGNPTGFDPNDPAWDEFERKLDQIKQQGYRSIPVDVWWGVVQKDRLKDFEWDHYDHAIKLILSRGFKLEFYLSTHSCGGNVGDTVDIPLPLEIRELLPTLAKGKDARYRSEGGNISNEVVSHWAVPYILPYYINFWKAFKERYAHLAPETTLIVPSLGSAGELTDPTYHSHDRNLISIREGKFIARYPHRGALQASSPLAREHFYKWLEKKWGSLEGVNRAWHTNYNSFQDIDFFTDTNKFSRFLDSNGGYGEFSPAGQDLFGWNHLSLMDSGLLVMDAFVDVFGGEDSAFKNVPIGHKTPGIHWSASRRLAMLMAGQLSTSGAPLAVPPGSRLRDRYPASWLKENGLGLSSLFENFILPLRRAHPKSHFVAIYTCAEQANCLRHNQFGPGFDVGDGDTSDFISYALTEAFINLGRRFGVTMGLENSLGGYLRNPWMVARLVEFASIPEVEYLSLLRMNDVVDNEVLDSGLKDLRAKRCREFLAPAASQ
ncbi:MAG: family 14 glycosylhydrolase [Bdellovibrionales bacterium]